MRRGIGAKISCQYLRGKGLYPFPPGGGRWGWGGTAEAHPLPPLQSDGRFLGRQSGSSGENRGYCMFFGGEGEGCITDCKIFVDMVEQLNYSPASPRQCCRAQMRQQPRVRPRVWQRSSDPEAESMQQPPRRSPPMRQMQTMLSSTSQAFHRHPSPARFLVRPQLLTRV
jgi:hypothetical protein